jgi:hypothetical protein
MNNLLRLNLIALTFTAFQLFGAHALPQNEACIRAQKPENKLTVVRPVVSLARGKRAF